MARNDVQVTEMVAYLLVGLLPLVCPAPAFAARTARCVGVDAFNMNPVHQVLSTTTNCCETATLAGGTALQCNPGNQPVPLSSLNSIVVIVADDNSYCHWGFMGGLCNDGSSLNPCQSPGVPGACSNGEQCSFGRCIRPCASNVACGPNDTCVSSDEYVRRRGGALSRMPPLRLNDPACRNRQVRSKRLNNCDDHKAESSEFGFYRDQAPCPRNDPGDDPHVLTPFVDEIANRGAVFPRAHVSGNACKPGRATFLFGRHNIHLGTVRTTPANSRVAVPAALDRLNADGSEPAPLTPCTSHNDCGLGGTCTSGGCGYSDYRSYLYLKGEVATENQAGFDAGTHGTNGPLGRITLDNCLPGSSWCARNLNEGKLPADPSAGGPAIQGLENQGGMFERMERDAEGVFKSDGGNGVWQQKPFLVWFAPNSPHEGGGVHEYFTALYQFEHSGSNKFFGRISQFDVAVGGILDGLKRRCVCDTGGSKRSLFDKTIVVLVTDNGFFLPKAKGKNNDNENTQRLPILISDPVARRGAPPNEPNSSVWNNELANSSDLLRTLQDLANDHCGDAGGVATKPNSGYPFSANLCAWVRTHQAPSDIDAIASTPPIRRVTYGHSSGEPFAADGNGSHYLITRAGRLGVCTGVPPDKKQARPCFTEYDCTPDQGTCQFPDQTGYMGSCSNGSPCLRDEDCGSGMCTPPANRGGRCANRPNVRCAIDRHCAEAVTQPTWSLQSLCGEPASDPLVVGPTCRVTEGSFGDFATAGGSRSSATCDTAQPEQCVPRGTCRPLVLKVKARKKEGYPEPIIREVFDLAADPDELKNVATSLGPEDSRLNLADGSLKRKMADCLHRFYTWCDQSPGNCAQPSSTTTSTTPTSATQPLACALD